MATISISKEKIERGRGVVALPVREYQRLLELAIPAYRLTGFEAKRLNRLVFSGLRAQKQKKTKRINSLADLD